jgi:UDP-N-acetylglucosamine 2-epimerase (non-hydrolysing)
MTIIGTRPELIRLSCVIKRCDEYFNQILVHTGQNYDYSLNQVFFKNLEIRKPDYFLNAVGKNLGASMGLIIAKSYEALQKEMPDALLVLGDTNSTLSVISAKRLKIPVFHMEAGNRCFDQNVPEEINRKIVDHISDINLPYTEHSRRYLIAEGFSQDRIFVTGSPMREVLSIYDDQISNSNILGQHNLSPKGYILISAHREENLDIEANFHQLMNAINDVAKKYKLPVIYSTHPRTQKRIDNSGFKFHRSVRNLKAFGFFDYVKLQKNAFCVLSDSGTITEESAMLGFPAVNIRNANERPEGVDMGALVMSGVTTDRIIEAMEMVTAKDNKFSVKNVYDYEIDYVSEKVVRIILSYTDYVNRNIWRK